MAHALSLAGRGLGRVWPNPAVGCVLVRDGRIVGRGRTADGGRPHAERVALDMAGDAARGGTAYVTLEPCAHHGQTPPCADALIDAGVARVVVAHEDPDPRVAGGGVARLRAARIDVTVGCLEGQARAIQAGFLSRVTRGRPWLTLKLALTLDGRIATASGESRWITGPEARRRVHAERAAHDAVLVGAGTARADDPDLTVRGLGDVGPGRVRIVLSRHLRLPRDSRLFQSAGDPPVWLIHAGADAGDVGAWEDAGARVIEGRSLGTQVDLAHAFEALGQAGLTRVYCEGGGTLAAALMTADLVDELQVFSAGKLIGAEGQPGMGALGLARLSEARAFDLAEVSALGGDIFHRWIRRV
ncbi:bifunctional diaminohydroxyphosphoribosylaminopyrimidine deaminase/5-amino-6-(5-phosphoribosylamino)uracil reductase RibD [Alphaproteobacteria bacterium GH1-50]|uniref:Riboflavin biosynthesis protein RibD n=2 Tax=Kangsaoukella pontilimi TaxID=2691042 RepID=A0A7C9MVX3_9RHOB|nr:bifunctional diaminohydroxyphosphoribosylaminopyrimidine deaminase/5-amino-6-(5-phosphoribosylamino)uracil reductase RibD [Kangsaoukella pontilimi]